MKQTPLQKLISGLDNTLKNENEYKVSDYGRGMVEAAKIIKIKATELLPYEQECLENAYHTAEVKLIQHLKARLGSDNKEQPNREPAKRYFNETYIKNN